MMTRWWPALVVLAMISCRQPLADQSGGGSTQSSHAESSASNVEAEDTVSSEGSPEGGTVDETIVITPDPASYHPESTPDAERASRLIVDLTNELRAERNLSKVKVDPKLNSAAESFARYMARTNRYGHRADGRDPADRVKEVKYEPCLIDENIAYGFRSNGFSTELLADEYFEGWKKSPGHLKNMLDADVTQTAVAIKEGEGGYFFAVQLFGRPASEMIVFKLTNDAGDEFEYRMGTEEFKLLRHQTRTHQACRSRELEFSWQDAEKREQTVTPQAGDHFFVARDGTAYSVQKH